MNKLAIDTSSNKIIVVSLEKDNRSFQKNKELGKEKAQVVLPLIGELLKEHMLFLRDIEKIEVNTGPGSFTGLRVGVTIANALSYVLKIPINGNKTGVFVEPVYE